VGRVMKRKKTARRPVKTAISANQAWTCRKNGTLRGSKLRKEDRYMSCRCEVRWTVVLAPDFNGGRHLPWLTATRAKSHACVQFANRSTSIRSVSSMLAMHPQLSPARLLVLHVVRCARRPYVPLGGGPGEALAREMAERVPSKPFRSTAVWIFLVGILRLLAHPK